MTRVILQFIKQIPTDTIRTRRMWANQTWTAEKSENWGVLKEGYSPSTCYNIHFNGSADVTIKSGKKDFWNY